MHAIQVVPIGVKTGPGYKDLTWPPAITLMDHFSIAYSGNFHQATAAVSSTATVAFSVLCTYFTGNKHMTILPTL
jgi:hypothetical protein